MTARRAPEPDVPTRFARLGRPDTPAGRDAVLRDLHLGPGSMADYAALAEHHYRAGRPATVTRVLTATWRRPTVVGRYLARPAERCVLAVLVESMPRLNGAMRDHAFAHRYGPWLSPAGRARLLGREVRCISRVVVDPRLRGLGLAVRLVREALRTASTPVTEALAAMGRVNPFFARAGMTPYPRPPHRADARLIDALVQLGLTPADGASARRLAQRTAQLTPADRRWLERELGRWHRAGPGRSRRDPAPLDQQWRDARSRLLLEPVYFAHVRPAPGSNCVPGCNSAPTDAPPARDPV